MKCVQCEVAKYVQNLYFLISYQLAFERVPENGNMQGVT